MKKTLTLNELREIRRIMLIETRLNLINDGILKKQSKLKQLTEANRMADEFIDNVIEIMERK